MLPHAACPTCCSGCTKTAQLRHSSIALTGATLFGKCPPGSRCRRLVLTDPPTALGDAPAFSRTSGCDEKAILSGVWTAGQPAHGHQRAHRGWDSGDVGFPQFEVVCSRVVPALALATPTNSYAAGENGTLPSHSASTMDGRSQQGPDPIRVRRSPRQQRPCGGAHWSLKNKTNPRVRRVQASQSQGRRHHEVLFSITTFWRANTASQRVRTR
jgi:hypothetical protein